MTNKQNPADEVCNNNSFLSNKKDSIDCLLDVKFDKMNKVGRCRKMKFSDILNCLELKNRYTCDTWKGLYLCIVDNRADERLGFDLPHYSNFLITIKSCLKFLLNLIQTTLSINRHLFFKKKDKIVFVDSTPLPVCKLIRSNRHKTMKEFAEYSKSTMGYYFGFKLHLTCDYETKNVLDFKITKAKVDDRKYLESLMKDDNLFFQSRTMFVADKGYQAKWLEELARETGNYLLTGKRKSRNNKTLASRFDIYLLHTRARIESIFGTLKTNHNLTNTKSRSVLGYLFNYVLSLFQSVCLSGG